ncbi:MAG: Flp pilus assembly complex ATPase component TadA [Deltaproteobacteria bacterium]|nr:Flp pilus assembly complex ATPase component TadA [Deltaproteobacteria bacterium]
MTASDTRNNQPPPSRGNGNALPPLPLGKILVQEGLVGEKDVERALSIQEKERKLQQLPLGMILVQTGVLNQSQVQELLQRPEIRRSVGSLAAEKGFLTQAQLTSCLDAQPSDHLIGQTLVQKGYLTRRDLETLLREQINAKRFGDLAVQQKMISLPDLEKALQIQKAPRKLGEILCDLGLLAPLDLQHVLSKYNKQIELGSLLVTMEYISEEQLREARQENPWGSETLGETLLRKQVITQEHLKMALSRQYNVPFRRLNGFAYFDDDKGRLVKIISQKYAERNLILPVALSGNRLTLAILRPETMVTTLYELQGIVPKLRVSCILITEEKFEELFEILYSRHLKAEGEGKDQEDPGTDIDFMELDIDEGIGQEETLKPQYGMRDIEAEELVNFILKYGIVNGASDIHIEQDRREVTLRYRLDGILRKSRIGWLQEKLQEKAPAIISRVKVMANLDIAEKRLPQDGGFRIHYHDKGERSRVDLDFRVATCRAAVGENLTIRILDPRKADVGLENLNHSPHVLNPYQTLLKSPSGMILVCGPTGSGKSSTLYASLRHIYSPGLKIITAEDPIEYNFPGIMQTQVNPKINLTFARLLRSFLRFDPDIILVGEIRDEETAKIGFDAAQTGHILLSTLHTNDAISAVSRLLDLKVEYGQIASSLMCILAQRLVRKICPSCIEETVPDEAEWGMLFKQYPSHLRCYRGGGCPACNFSGYLGRTLLSEIFVVDGEVAQALNRGYEEDRIKELALESGMKTMIDDGLGKLGQTTLSEIIRMVPHDMIQAFRKRQRTQQDIDMIMEAALEQQMEDTTPNTIPRLRIVNPDLERSRIDVLQASFERLRSETNGDQPPVDPPLFKEFIATSHARICKEYGCSEVTFEASINPRNGKAAISAFPET